MFLVHLKDQRFLLKIYLLLNYNTVKSDLKNKSAYNILFQQLREPKDALLGSREVQTAGVGYSRKYWVGVCGPLPAQNPYQGFLWPKSAKCPNKRANNIR